MVAGRRQPECLAMSSVPNLGLNLETRYLQERFYVWVSRFFMCLRQLGELELCFGVQPGSPDLVLEMEHVEPLSRLSSRAGKSLVELEFDLIRHELAHP